MSVVTWLFLEKQISYQRFQYQYGKKQKQQKQKNSVI